MRLDYTLYILAVVFFIITTTSVILLTGTNQTVWIISSTALGAISIVAGLIQTRNAKNNQIQTTAPTPTPDTKTQIQNIEPTPTTPATKTPIQTSPTLTESTETQTPEPTTQTPLTPQTIKEETTTKLLLTDVVGIGEKRAGQLNSIGITTVDELAQASAKNIAKALKVSSKIAAKWVREAKKLSKNETIVPLS